MVPPCSSPEPDGAVVADDRRGRCTVDLVIRCRNLFSGMPWLQSRWGRPVPVNGKVGMRDEIEAMGPVMCEVSTLNMRQESPLVPLRR